MGTLRERFEAKVDRSGGPDACHPWTAATNENGYGVIRPDGQRAGPSLKAHRVAAMFAGMEIDGLKVLHSCDSPPCCNARHLFTGTQAQNLADMRAKGRHNIGERNGAAKLTEADVRTIRERVAAGESQRVLCAEFGLTPGPMSMLVNRKTWVHVA